MTLDTQFLTMLFMILGGFYLGLARDTFRRFSPYWKGKLVTTYFMEICFWLTQTFILFYVLFLVNGGELRVYIFLACLLGVAMYQVLAAALYKKLLEGVIRAVAAVCRFISKTVQAVLITPVWWVIQTLFICLAAIVQFILSVLLFIGKGVFYPCRWLLQLIYRLLPSSMQKIIYKCAGIYSIIANMYNRLVKYIKFKRR